LRSFEQFLGAAHITDDIVRVETLLRVAGAQVKSIYSVRAKADDKYENVVKCLNDYFLAIVNFCTAQQMQGEGDVEFVGRLKSLAAKCDFKTEVENRIHSQFIRGCILLRYHSIKLN